MRESEIEKWRAFLKRVQLRLPFPVTMHLVGDELDGGTRISMTWRVPDVDRPADMARIHMMVRVSDEFREDIAVWEIRKLLESMWKHEIDEGFRLDGKHVTDPHPELRR